MYICSYKPIPLWTKKTPNLNNEPGEAWGGLWTQQKINVFLKYLKAYLDIMKLRPYFELIYFDGFAGSGTIPGNAKFQSAQESIALQVIGIEHERVFDIYYLVDKDGSKVKSLKENIKNQYPGSKKVYAIEGDCNEKLKALVRYLNEKPNHRKALALVDPFGMQVNWDTIAGCKGLSIDLWILIPTGLGVSRMLKRDGQISEGWLEKLERFLGIPREEIKDYFYKQKIDYTLFGEELTLQKEANVAHRAAELYVRQLKTVWDHVSNPFPMKNSTNSVMYHFVLATNSRAGLKIGNDIIGKQLNTN